VLTGGGPIRPASRGSSPQVPGKKHSSRQQDREIVQKGVPCKKKSVQPGERAATSTMALRDDVPSAIQSIWAPRSCGVSRACSHESKVLEGGGKSWTSKRRRLACLKAESAAWGRNTKKKHEGQIMEGFRLDTSKLTAPIVP